MFVFLDIKYNYILNLNTILIKYTNIVIILSIKVKNIDFKNQKHVKINNLEVILNKLFRIVNNWLFYKL